MTSELERRFFADELDAYVRDLLLAAIAQQKGERVQFTFNTVDVLIDFESQTATLEDVFADDEDVSFPLMAFRDRLISIA